MIGDSAMCVGSIEVSFQVTLFFKETNRVDRRVDGVVKNFFPCLLCQWKEEKERFVGDVWSSVRVKFVYFVSKDRHQVVCVSFGGGLDILKLFRNMFVCLTKFLVLEYV
mmetsp:Transcript_28437/g.40238  ORF Transcript_28437/g.40238 Transcript_28437/m.40238 type:complete len:109 (+) Transcript_28437:1554-1880(+)